MTIELNDVWKYRARRVPSGDLFYSHTYVDELNYSLNRDTITVFIPYIDV